MPEPIVWTHLICDLLWSGAAALSISGLASGLSEDADQLSRQLSEVEDSPISQAFAEGRTSVVSMVAEAGLTARRAFDGARERLVPSVAEEIEHRLDEMGKRLEDLGYDAGCASR